MNDAMVDYHPLAEIMRHDPLPVYEQLRKHSPVHYVEDIDSWALSRFEDVWSAGQNPELYRSPGPALLNGVLDSDEGQRGNSSIFGMNPPQHTILRKQLTRLFSPRAVSKLEPMIRSTVREYIESALPVGRLDVITDLGIQISVRVACTLIELPLSDADLLVNVVRRYFTREPGVEGMPPDAIAAAEELHGYLLDAVRDRRRRGVDGDDALTTYFGFQPEGRPLTDEELADHLDILVVGGTETLPKVFAGGIIQLHRHPDQRAALIADPSLIPMAFNEIARYEMPTQFLTRRATRDHELRGMEIREGQGILFLYRSANRDAAEFDEPDRFDIHRNPTRILSFGHGAHVCLGQHAARLEGRVMLEELLATVPDYSLDEDEVVPERSEFVAGYVSVPIHFDPR
ncbi:cytochrome P450 [Myxococcota bacterium]|nr:cytochrome P450 [Myxococcota bacterium]